MIRALCGLLLLAPAALWAGDAERVVANLIAGQWRPQVVRVEWSFRGAPPAPLTDHTGWCIADPKPRRWAGSLIITLERVAETGGVQRMGISGNARIFGPVLSPARDLGAGSPVGLDDFLPAEAEWTRLHADVADSADFSGHVITARKLIPGRPLTVADLRPAPRIRKGQTVDIVYADGGVTIRLAGRAVKDGATGDVIPVAVQLSKPRRFEGTVAADGTVRLTR